MSPSELTPVDRQLVSARLKQTLRRLAPKRSGVPRWLVDFFAEKTLTWLFSGGDLPLFSREDLRNEYWSEHPSKRYDPKISSAELERRLEDSIDKALTGLSNRLARLAQIPVTPDTGMLVSLTIELSQGTYELQLTGFLSAQRTGLDFPEDAGCGLLARLLPPALETGAQPSPPPTQDAFRRFRWSKRNYKVRLITAAALLGLMSAAVIFYIRHRCSPSPLPNSIAVLSFRDDSGRADTTWMAKVIPEMLASVFAADGKHTVASGEDVDRVSADLSLTTVAEPPDNILLQIQKNLCVEYVVTGSYKVEPTGLLRVDANLVKVGVPQSSRQAFATGTADQLFAVVTRLARKSGFEPLSSADTLAAQALFPKSPLATRYYVEGLGKLRHQDAFGARDLLTHATQIERIFPLAHSALSAAYSKLGTDDAAIAEAKTAVDLATGSYLADRQKRQIQVRLLAAGHNWDKLVAADRELHTKFPNSLTFGLDLVSACLKAFKPHEALDALADLRRTLPSPLRCDPRLDLLESEAHQDLSHPEEQQTFAVAATDKARRFGARSLVARGRLLEAGACQTLGNGAETDAAATEARDLFSALGDLGNKARAIEVLAKAQDDKNYDAELRLFNDALNLHKQVGDPVSVARVLVNIGTIHVWKGESAEADKLFNDSLQIFRNQHDKYSEAITHNTIGSTYFFHGDLDGAETGYRTALAIFDGISDAANSATAQANVGEVYEYRAELDKARGWFEDARSQHRDAKDSDGVAYDDLRLGEVFALKGDFVNARLKYKAALDGWKSLRDSVSAADAALALATLAVLEGSAPEAESAIRDAEKIFSGGGASDRSLRSLGLLADCLLAQGRQQSAERVWERMSQMTQKSKDEHIRIATVIVHARVIAATKKSDDITTALQMLQQAAAEASHTQLVLSALDVRLATGQIKAAAGSVEGKQELATLVRDANVPLIARRAAASLTYAQ